MNTLRPPTIDPVASERWARRLPVASAWLHEEVARRMEERLDLITLQPQSWLHWEPLRGGLQAHALLQQRYPRSESFAVLSQAEHGHEAAKRMVKPWWRPERWRTPTTQWARPAQSVQMLWANMALHMVPDPQALIAEWHGLLAIDGFLMFSCLGPDTLLELRALYRAWGWPPPAHDFTDMHDWGDMLVQAGFAEPVMDQERITLSFATPERLLQELRELGRNLHGARFSGLRGRGWHASLLAGLAQRLAPAGGAGPLTLTFEIIYGHAFKPAPRLHVRPETRLTVEEMRASLRQVNKKPPTA
ncbi:MAG: biotin synthase [Rhodoferax sp.]|nr:biotin synthase [Rhodoferax sp.]